MAPTPGAALGCRHPAPLAGFAGKVLLLGAAIDGGMAWLAVIAATNMAVALFYYARVVAEMYFAPDGRTTMAAPGLGYVLSAVVATAGTLASGILPALGLGPVGLSAILLRRA
jgi:NADH-quinone oxidoreductase subunit N